MSIPTSSNTQKATAKPANMDLVEMAFDQHWRHDGGYCMIPLSEFKSHQLNDHSAYTLDGVLYYSDGCNAWSIDLEYLN